MPVDTLWPIMPTIPLAQHDYSICFWTPSLDFHEIFGYRVRIWVNEVLVFCISRIRRYVGFEFHLNWLNH